MSTDLEKMIAKTGQNLIIGEQLVKRNEIEKVIQALTQMNNSFVDLIENAESDERMQELLSQKNDVQDALNVAIRRESISKAIKMLNDPNARPEVHVSVATGNAVESIASLDTKTTATILRTLLRQTDTKLFNQFKKLTS